MVAIFADSFPCLYSACGSRRRLLQKASPRSFRYASRHNHPAARYRRTIPVNPVQPVTSLSRLRRNRPASRSGRILFRRLEVSLAGGPPRSVDHSVN